MNQCALFIPHMWRELFNNLSTADRYNNKSFRDLVSITFLDVSETGLDAPQYGAILRSCESTHCIPILLLPVTHCSLNITAERLRILGPAVATRDDIFVFRLASPCRPAPYYIAVKDYEITTTNLLRIVIANWSPNFLDHTGAGMDDAIITSVAHIQEEMPRLYDFGLRQGVKDRIKAMQDGTHHAAVFMGEDLNLPDETPDASNGGETITLFDRDDFIDVMNINRVINRIYNVSWFPRAVFVTFEQFEKNEMIGTFCNTYNAALAGITPSGPHGWPTQKLCKTGRYTENRVASTLIHFTKDIHSPKIMKMRRHSFGGDLVKITETSRALKPSDFVWYPYIFGHTFDQILLQTVCRHYTRLASESQNATYIRSREKALLAMQKNPPKGLEEFRNLPGLRKDAEQLWRIALKTLDGDE